MWTVESLFDMVATGAQRGAQAVRTSVPHVMRPRVQSQRHAPCCSTRDGDAVPRCMCGCGHVGRSHLARRDDAHHDETSDIKSLVPLLVFDSGAIQPVVLPSPHHVDGWVMGHPMKRARQDVHAMQVDA